MSLVTTTVVFGQYIPDATKDRLLHEGWQYPHESPRKAIFGDLCREVNDDIPGVWGGSKYPEAEVYGGAFNHLPVHDFLDWLRSLDWGETGAVVVWESNGESQGVEKLGNYRENP